MHSDRLLVELLDFVVRGNPRIHAGMFALRFPEISARLVANPTPSDTGGIGPTCACAGAEFSNLTVPGVLPATEANRLEQHKAHPKGVAL